MTDQAVEWVKAGIDAEQARARLTARSGSRFQAAWTWLKRRLGLPAGPTRQRLDLVHLPCAKVEVTAHRPDGSTSRLILLVRGYEETVDVWPQPAVSHAPPSPNTTRWKLPLAPDRILELARLTVTRWRLGRVIPSAVTGPLICRMVGEVHYPYWVCYYERRGGLIDFQMLDAVEGRATHALTRRALMKALRAKSARPIPKNRGRPFN